MANIHPPKQQDMKYLHLLAQSFPNISEASMEIINLQAILHLPKGTEHFLADIHGEYEAFQHILKMPRRIEQIYPLQGAQVVAPRFLVYHPGTPS